MRVNHPKTALVTGAAGFIGSHLSDHLLAQGLKVIGLDNLSRGRRTNLNAALQHDTFHFVELDINDGAQLQKLFRDFPIDIVWHMVANSDIAAGVEDPSIDLRDTFLSTFHLLLAMRAAKVRELAFASTSAVYGVHPGALKEDTGPLFPISNYGAMKLASEAAVSAAVESFLERAWIFRFPNVVGARATHGIIFDLLAKLKRTRAELEVLGDGSQQKPYLHVSELIEAMASIVVNAQERINCFNIGPEDDGVLVRDIAKIVLEVASPTTPIRFTGGSRGWVGDVPRFQYSIEKLKALGWTPRLASRDAIARSTNEIYSEMFTDGTLS